MESILLLKMSIYKSKIILHPKHFSHKKYNYKDWKEYSLDTKSFQRHLGGNSNASSKNRNNQSQANISKMTVNKRRPLQTKQQICHRNGSVDPERRRVMYALSTYCIIITVPLCRKKASSF